MDLGFNHIEIEASMSEYVNAEELVSKVENIKTIACVTYFGRSGSFLFASLLDDHPHILTVPNGPEFQTLLVNLYMMIQNCNGRQTSGIMLLDQIMKTCSCLFTEETRYWQERGREGIERGVEKKKFRKFLKACLVNNNNLEFDVQYIFKSIFISYAAASGRQNLSNFPVIVWQKHKETTSQERIFIKKLLRDVIFLVCIRDPAATFSSLFAHRYISAGDMGWDQETRNPTFDRLVTGGSRRHNEKNIKIFSIRYEDMHMNSEILMRNVAEILSIPWNDKLLISTEDGRPFYMESSTGDFITGLDPRRAVNQKHHFLSWFDKIRMRYALRDYYQAWEYEGNSTLFDKILYNISWFRGIIMWIPTKYEVWIWWKTFQFFLNMNMKYRRNRIELWTGNHISDESSQNLPIPKINIDKVAIKIDPHDEGENAM